MSNGASCQGTAAPPGPVSTKNRAKIAVGDKLPEAELGYVDGEGNIKTIKVSELTAGKKVVIFAVPGAFTRGCSQRHVPAFVAKADDLKGKGVDTIVCVSVNDVFVMKAWGEDRGATDKIWFLSDGEADFAKALGVERDLREYKAGMGIRSSRYALLAEDGVVKVFNLEAGTGIDVSLPEGILSHL